MSVRDKFYEIMEHENGFDETYTEVEEMLRSEKETGNIKDFTLISDTDVFDSCGLSIYYVSISWIDNENKLQIAGSCYWLT